MLKNKKIVVGLTGGIAAYKIPPLIRLLKKEGAEVRCIMTEASTKFITELTIETLSHNPVAREMFPRDRFVGTHHIDIALWADLFIVAPATANFLGKIASGICDDMLTTVICAAGAPVMIAPAMNSNMYLNPITQKNIVFLKSSGYRFIDPGVGELACETSGPGRMAEPEEILVAIKKFFEKKKLLTKKKVVVTAGPCREPLDPVRYISNRSSGKMGYAIAEAAAEAGAEVTLVSGPTNLTVDGDIKLIKVETTEEMASAVTKEYKNCHYLIMAAAPSDFKPSHPADQKIKKTEKKSLLVEFDSTIDILKSIKKLKKKSQRVIGFALETENGLQNARKKLKEKALDLIVLNRFGESTPFDSDSNEVELIDKNGRAVRLPRMNKTELARLLIEKIAGLK
jgi:phosphopantothenoylcysteine decarboxylase / phosphopantothenate---cysteine ligase